MPFSYVSLPRALPSLLFDVSVLTALSCKFSLYGKSTIFSSQMQVTSRSGQKKGSLRITGTLELIPARPPSPSIPPALHVGIFAVVRVTSAEESWTNEVKCHEKNAV